jgi:hypothetical protein
MSQKNMPNRLTTLKSYTDGIEAELDKNRLIASGIDALIIKDDCAHLYPSLNLGYGVHLKVLQSNLEEARKLLGISNNQREDLAFEFQKNKNALYSILILILNGIGFGLLVAGFTIALKIIGIIFLVSGIGLWGTRKLFYNKSTQ